MISQGVTFQFFSVSYSQTTSDQQDFRANVRSLVDAIKNGDLQGAKDAYAKIADGLKGKSDADNDDEASETPFEKLFEKLGDALSSNDIGKAQKALTEFEANQAKGPLPEPAPPELVPLSDNARSALSAFVDLIKALRSEKLTEAKDAYTKLQGLRSEDANSAKTRLDNFLEQIGAALQKDDLSAAQDVLQTLTQQQPYGGALDLTA